MVEHLDLAGTHRGILCELQLGVPGVLQQKFTLQLPVDQQLLNLEACQLLFFEFPAAFLPVWLPAVSCPLCQEAEFCSR